MLSMNQVELTAFERSLAALARAIAMFDAYGKGELLVMARNSLILGFEICFGQCRPMLERCLAEIDGEPTETVKNADYADLIRLANKRGYLQVTWREWRTFREARNRTAHAYNEPMAADIVSIIPAYYAAATELLKGMQRKVAER